MATGILRHRVLYIIKCSHQRAASWLSIHLTLSLTPCFSASLIVFEDAINKINQLAGGYLPFTNTHTNTHTHTRTEVNTRTSIISLTEIHPKNSTKHHHHRPLPTEGIKYKLSKFNMAQSHHSNKRFRSVTRLIRFHCYTHTLISMWQKLSCWKHLAIMPSCGEITLKFHCAVEVTVWRSILLLF